MKITHDTKLLAAAKLAGRREAAGQPYNFDLARLDVENTLLVLEAIHDAVEELEPQA